MNWRGFGRIRAVRGPRNPHPWLLALAIAIAVVSAFVLPGARAQGAPVSADAGAAAPANASAQGSSPSRRSDSDPPSVAIYPPQTIPLRFNHQQHIQMQLACIDCHADAKTSESVADHLLPLPTKCDSCHLSNHANIDAVTGGPGLASCATCHVGYTPTDGNRVQRVHMPDANLVFSHRVHNARNIGCAQCHANVDQLALATRDQLPRMQSCLRCHTGDGVNPTAAKPLTQAERSDNGKLPRPAAAGIASTPPQGTCDTCHLRAENQPGGVIRTEFPSGKMLPPRWMRNAQHDAGFLARHKFVAGDDSRFCASCHKEDECVACHDGRIRPRSIHPNDYLSMHPIESRQATQNCQSCHREQSFCVGCHQRLGIAMSSPTGVRESNRFHPPKQTFSDLPRKPGHHAEQAVRNLAACVSCHVERDCTSCHAAAGIGAGFNPHPPGFVARCQSMLSRNPRPCLVCHENRADALERCR
jgi:Cytochrome c7 and related cytochrome c